MDWLNFHSFLLAIQHGISFAGILVILSGVLLALYQYLRFVVTGEIAGAGVSVNAIRLHLGRILILGLEFIVAADLIGTTTAPDYYSVGILGMIVIIRTVLSFTLNREMISLSKETETE